MVVHIIALFLLSDNNYKDIDSDFNKCFVNKLNFNNVIDIDDSIRNNVRFKLRMSF